MIFDDIPWYSQSIRMDIAIRISRPICFWHLIPTQMQRRSARSQRSTFTVDFNQAAPFVGSSVTNVQSSVLASSAAGLSTPFEEEKHQCSSLLVTPCGFICAEIRCISYPSVQSCVFEEGLSTCFPIQIVLGGTSSIASELKESPLERPNAAW